MTDQHDHQELASALQAVIEDRTKVDAEERTALTRRRTNAARTPWAGVLTIVLGLAAIAWLWTARPAFVFGPGTMPPRSAEAREARLRFALYLSHARVQRHLAAHSRLPASLADIGPLEDGVVLDATGGEWQLRGTTDGVTLVLTQRMDADSFLGNAVQVLRADQ